MVVRRVAVLFLLAGCGLEPLSREQLFGLPSVLPKVRLTGTASDAVLTAVLEGVEASVATSSFRGGRAVMPCAAQIAA